MRYAGIRGNLVMNVVLIDDPAMIPIIQQANHWDRIVQSDVASPGWTYDGIKFFPNIPEPYVPPLEDRIEVIEEWVADIGEVTHVPPPSTGPNADVPPVVIPPK